MFPGTQYAIVTRPFGFEGKRRMAIADWGIASILMYNPLNGVGPGPKDAEMAQAAIDAGRAMPAKTQRERDYLEAVAAYYQDWAGHPERERQQARAKAGSPNSGLHSVTTLEPYASAAAGAGIGRYVRMNEGMRRWPGTPSFSSCRQSGICAAAHRCARRRAGS